MNWEMGLSVLGATRKNLEMLFFFVRILGLSFEIVFLLVALIVFFPPWSSLLGFIC